MHYLADAMRSAPFHVMAGFMPSTPSLRKQDVDGCAKRGHDVEGLVQHDRNALCSNQPFLIFQQSIWDALSGRCDEIRTLPRHGRLYAGHPRLPFESKTWMAAPSAAMTWKGWFNMIGTRSVPTNRF